MMPSKCSLKRTLLTVQVSFRVNLSILVCLCNQSTNMNSKSYFRREPRQPSWQAFQHVVEAAAKEVKNAQNKMGTSTSRSEQSRWKRSSNTGGSATCWPRQGCASLWGEPRWAHSSKNRPAVRTFLLSCWKLKCYFYSSSAPCQGAQDNS